MHIGLIGTNAVMWLALAIVLGIIEIFTVGFFMIFFAFGALLAAVVSLFNGTLWLQGLVFIVGSLLMVWLARPVLKRAFQVGDKPSHESNVGALLGAEVLVLEDVGQYTGKAKVIHTGETWTAYLAPPLEVEYLSAGSPGIIVRVDGAKLAIRPKA